MRTALDARLVKRAQGGDREALAAVTDACRELFGRALSKRGVFGDAREDTLQEALTVVVQQLAGFQWRASFETWALAVLFRVQQRQRERETLRGQRQALESEVGEEDDGSVLDRAVGRLGDPAREAEGSALRVALADCAGRVPIEMREVWLRHRIRGQEHHLIAQALELSINTVGTRIYRVDRKLRDCLESKGYTPEVIGVR
jgi:RNA polymerase sigma-70 factor (ECF subfamily)